MIPNEHDITESNLFYRLGPLMSCYAFGADSLHVNNVKMYKIGNLYVAAGEILKDEIEKFCERKHFIDTINAIWDVIGAPYISEAAIRATLKAARDQLQKLNARGIITSITFVIDKYGLLKKRSIFAEPFLMEYLAETDEEVTDDSSIPIIKPSISIASN